MKHFLICLMAALAFVGCTDEGPDDGGSTQPQAAITLTTTALNFATEGGSQNVSFTTSGEWTAQVINDRANDWCTIAPVSGAAGIGQLIVKASANDTTDERSASIIIKSGTEQKTIKVTQKQKDALTVTASKFEVAAEGGTVAIEVKANIDFSYAVDGASQSWIKYQTTRAMKTSTLVFDIAEIDSRDKRQGTITISSGELKEVVTIYQDGTKPTIVISKNEYVIGSEGGSVAVEVKSNVDVSVELPSDVEWLSESTTRALSTNTYYFDVAENTGYDQRSATIVFTNKADNLTEEVTITQMQKDAIVLAASEYNIDARGGALDFEIQTNVDITAKTSATWIEQVATRGLESKMLFFDIAANDAQEAREGTITLSGGNATQTIIVKQAANVCQENEIWYTSSNGEIVVPYNADAFGASIVSNTYVNGKGIIKFNQAVTGIGENAFYYCSKLTSITIPNSVTSIGYYAFFNCSSLSSITIPNSVTSIGDYAFEGCSSLTSITIPNSVTSIGSGAFYNCSSLTSITIPNSVTSIGYYAFQYCSSLKEFKGKFASTDSRCLIIDSSIIAFAPAGLTEYAIPNSVTSIGYEAFYGCSSLTSINIPISVTSIEAFAFFDCSSLTSINIPDSVTYIGSGALCGCSSLKEFKGKFASTDSRCLIFNNALIAFAPAGLTEYTIPDSVTSIGPSAFSDCSSLTSINIPNSVTSIRNNAFRGCSSLTSINIPNSVTSIGDSAFSNCSSLTSITIPNSVTSIGYYAFYRCSSLTSITIPNNVTSIGSYAFSYCSSLTSITIPNSVTSIGNYAFYRCSSLQNIICNPTNPPTGGTRMFDDISSSAKIYVPTGSGDAYKAATYWSDYADMIVEMGTETPPNNPDPSPEDPDTLPDNEIWYTSSNGEIVVPYNADAFGASIVSNTYVNGKGIIKFNQAVTSIGEDAFEYCSKLTSINIPNSVTSIGSGAFYYCSSLTSINIPNSVTSIGYYAFGGCSKLREFNGKFASTDSRCLIVNNALIAFAPAGLTEYTIPNSVTSIGNHAFFYCSSLTSITIPNSVTSIGSYAFSGCSSLTSITIPNSVTSIRDRAFLGCSSLTSITIPNSVTSIGEYAFGGCSKLREFNGKFASTDSRCLIVNNALIAFAPAGLTEYTIPDSVTSIGGYAFCACSSLTSITIPNSVTYIGYYAFKRCSSLQNIICNPTNPPTGGEGMFDGISSSAKIYVPTGSGDAYKAAEYWSNYKDMIVEM